jgi:hypothetical protein
VNSLTDRQLLCAYAERCSAPAFAELVRRHVDLIYFTAVRMVRDTHLAEDVTQGASAAPSSACGTTSPAAASPSAPAAWPPLFPPTLSRLRPRAWRPPFLPPPRLPGPPLPLPQP